MAQHVNSCRRNAKGSTYVLPELHIQVLYKCCVSKYGPKILVQLDGDCDWMNLVYFLAPCPKGHTESQASHAVDGFGHSFQRLLPLYHMEAEPVEGRPQCSVVKPSSNNQTRLSGRYNALSLLRPSDYAFRKTELCKPPNTSICNFLKGHLVAFSLPGLECMEHKLPGIAEHVVLYASPATADRLEPSRQLVNMVYSTLKSSKRPPHTPRLHSQNNPRSCSFQACPVLHEFNPAHPCPMRSKSCPL